MKKLFSLGIPLLLNLIALSQTDQHTYADLLKGTYQFPKEVEVGKPMPDLPLGNVINNYTGKTRFSDFKGKLVILDFWDVHCSACVAGFPKMSKLQEKFKDQIQILLVNTVNTSKEIDNKPGLRSKIPANLPSIEGATHIEEIFPRWGEIGYHVWIDKNGIVRQRGSGYLVTYEQKIIDILDGKPIEFITDKYTRAYTDLYQKAPLYTIARETKAVVKYSSFLTGYNDLLSYAAYQTESIDSNSLTLRRSYINQDAFELYYNAIKTRPDIKIAQNHLINYPYDIRGLAGVTFTLPARAERFTDVFFSPEEWTDAWYRQHRFCYEQICPLSLLEDKRSEFMLQDLNRFFREQYGIEGHIERKKMNCYVLIKASSDNLLQGTRQQLPLRNVAGLKQYSTLSLVSVLRYYTVDIFKADVRAPFYDQTGITGPVQIALPKYIANMEQLKIALKPYGLDIIQQERICSILEIRDIAK